MQHLIKDEKVWMALFQESLTKSALQKYMSLSSKNIKSWANLVHAFMNNYKYTKELAHNLQLLQNLERQQRVVQGIRTTVKRLSIDGLTCYGLKGDNHFICSNFERAIL